MLNQSSSHRVLIRTARTAPLLTLSVLASLALFSGCSSLDPPQQRAQEFLSSADQNAEIGKMAIAKADINSAIAETPNDESIYYETSANDPNQHNIAGIFTRLGDDPDLLLYMREAHAKFPGSDAPLMILMDCDARLGNTKALRDDSLAEIALEQPQMSRNSFTAEKCSSLFDAYFNVGNISAARTVFAQGRTRFGADQQILNSFAYCVAVAADKADYTAADADAVQALATANKIASDSPTYVAAVQDTLGWIQYREGKYSDSLYNLQTAISANPDVPELEYHLGAAYLAAGNAQAARVQFERAMVLDPTYLAPKIAEAAMEPAVKSSTAVIKSTKIR